MSAGDCAHALVSFTGVVLFVFALQTMAFALLGFLTLHRAVGNVPSCTGAGYGCALGKVCWGVSGSRAGPPPLPAVI